MHLTKKCESSRPRFYYPETAIKTSVDQLVRASGPPDILVNCVGIHCEETLLEVTEDAFDEV